jgi:hypothetical protein
MPYTFPSQESIGPLTADAHGNVRYRERFRNGHSRALATCGAGIWLEFIANLQPARHPVVCLYQAAMRVTLTRAAWSMRQTVESKPVFFTKKNQKNSC